MEHLHARDVPTTLTWVGVGDATYAPNWDPPQIPTGGDELIFNGARSNGNSQFLASMGEFSAIRLLNGYLATVSFGTAIWTQDLELRSRSIDQWSADRELTVTDEFIWTGGVLNSGDTASVVHILGTAIIDPPDTGTIKTGSTLSFEGGAKGTVDPGSVEFANGSVLVTESYTAIEFNLSGTIDFIQDPMPPAGVNALGGTHTAKGGELLHLGAPTLLTGTITVTGGGILSCSGGDANTVSLYQDSPTSELTIENKSSFIATRGYTLARGTFSTLAKPNAAPVDQIVKIQGDFNFLGGDVYINKGSLNPHTWGRLNVTGNAKWSGGKLHILVSNTVNGLADTWVINGTLTVDTTGMTKPEVAVGTDNNQPPIPSTWMFIRAVGGITRMGDMPSAGTLFRVIDDGAPLVTEWSLIPRA